MQPIKTPSALQSSRLVFQCEQELRVYLHSLDEEQRLSYLVSIALSDESLRDRLLMGDEQLLSEYGFSRSIRRWLGQLQAESLEELAQEMLACDWSTIHEVA